MFFFLRAVGKGFISTVRLNKPTVEAFLALRLHLSCQLSWQRYGVTQMWLINNCAETQHLEIPYFETDRTRNECSLYIFFNVFCMAWNYTCSISGVQTWTEYKRSTVYPYCHNSVYSKSKFRKEYTVLTSQNKNLLSTLLTYIDR